MEWQRIADLLSGCSQGALVGSESDVTRDVKISTLPSTFQEVILWLQSHLTSVSHLRTPCEAGRTAQTATISFAWHSFAVRIAITISPFSFGFVANAFLSTKARDYSPSLRLQWLRDLRVTRKARSSAQTQRRQNRCIPVMAPALTVIPDHTLQHLDHLLSDHDDLDLDLDHLIGHLEERSGGEMKIPQSREAVVIHDDLACDMKTTSGGIVIDSEAHTRI
jgi:hypothetical protein